MMGKRKGGIAERELEIPNGCGICGRKGRKEKSPTVESRYYRKCYAHQSGIFPLGTNQMQCIINISSLKYMFDFSCGNSLVLIWGSDL